MSRVRSQSGQMLLLALLILLSLGLSLFVTLFLNHYLTHSSVYLLSKQKGIQIGDAAMSYATVQLSDPTTTWAAALTGTFPAGFDGVTRSTGTFGTYTIKCSIGNSGLVSGDLLAAPYEVRTVAEGYVQSGINLRPTRAVEALLGPLTVGASLGNTTAVGAALELMQYPQIGTAAGYGDLLVHWGPIVAFSAMTIDGTSACSGVACITGDGTNGNHPRLFSVDAIVPMVVSPTPPPTTDNVFYWGYMESAMWPPLGINVGAYQNAATASTISTAHLVMHSCTPQTPSSGFIFCQPGGWVEFQDNYSFANSTSVIYIAGGDAQVYGRFAVDLSSCGALVVDGNLTFNPGGIAGGLNNISLHVPPTASKEYVTGTNFPCSTGLLDPYGDGSRSCGSSTAGDQYVDFKGFLYVTGSLIVKGGAGSIKRVLVGSVRVGDSPTGTSSILNVFPGYALHIYYDDLINRSINATSLVIMRDAVVDLPPR